MKLSSFSQLPELNVKKWVVHRSDGYLLKFTLSDTQHEALDKFLAKKHPNKILTPLLKASLWRYYQKFNFTINEITMGFEKFKALVNENPNV